MKQWMKTLKKKTVCVLAFAMLAALSLTACGGKSDEEVIREGITEELDEVKNLGEEFLTELVDELDDSSDLALLGVDSETFCRAILDGFDYSVDNITVDGDEATITVTLTLKDVTAIMGIWAEDIMNFAIDEEALSMTEDELYEKMGEMLMTSFEEGAMKDMVLDLPYEKIDNVWQGTEEAEEMIANAISGQ